MGENEIGSLIVEAAIDLHRGLGPGLLESVYELLLAREIAERGLLVERQVPIAIEYKGITFDEGFRADLVLERKVIVEIKSVPNISGSHLKQLQTYLRLTGCRLGYLLNFGDEVMRTGIRRCVNGLEEHS